MEMEEASTLVDAVMRFAYNAEFDEFVRVFPSANVDYCLEKYRFMSNHLSSFFSVLDSVHKERFLRAAVDRYNEKNGGNLDLVERT